MTQLVGTGPVSSEKKNTGKRAAGQGREHPRTEAPRTPWWEPREPAVGKGTGAGHTGPTAGPRTAGKARGTAKAPERPWPRTTEKDGAARQRSRQTAIIVGAAVSKADGAEALPQMRWQAGGHGFKNGPHKHAHQLAT